MNMCLILFYIYIFFVLQAKQQNVQCQIHSSIDEGEACSNQDIKHDQLFGQRQPALQSRPLGNSGQRKVMCDESLVKRSIQNISCADCLH